MRIKRALFAPFAVVPAAIALGLVSLANAAAPAAPHLSVDVTSGPPGTAITVTGTGFCSAGCTTVTIEFNGFPVDKGISVAPDGSFQVKGGVSGGSGTVEILATQQRNPPAQGTIQAFTYFTVTPGAPPSGPANPSAPGVTTTTVTPTRPTTPRPTPLGGQVTTTTSVKTTTTTTIAERSTTTSSAALGIAAHSPSGDGGLSAAAIAGIVAASVIALAGVAYWRVRARSRA